MHNAVRYEGGDGKWGDVCSLNYARGGVITQNNACSKICLFWL